MASATRRITLTTPGTVTLSSVGIDFTAVRDSADGLPGVVRLELLGARPDLVRRGLHHPAQRAARRQRARALAITRARSKRWGAAPACCDRGLGWTDYSMSFDTRVLDSSTGWLVRATSATSGYLFILSEAAGEARSPDTLQEFALGPGEFAVIGDVALPGTIVAGRWHHVTTVASGTDITTSIDGRQVATFDTTSLPSGASAYGSGRWGSRPWARRRRSATWT